MAHAFARLIQERKEALGISSDRALDKLLKGRPGFSTLARWQREPLTVIPDEEHIRNLADALDVSPETVYLAAVDAIADNRGYTIHTTVGRWAAEIGTRAESLSAADRRIVESLVARLDEEARRTRRRRK